MTQPTFEPGLEAMVWPISRAEFLAEYWQKKPLLVRGSVARLASVARLYGCEAEADADADAGGGDEPAERDRRPVAASAGGGFDLVEILRRANLEDTRVILRPTPAVMPAQTHDIGTLLTMYNAGIQLYISTSGADGVQSWIDALARDIGIVGSRGRGDIYATKTGGGVDMHFDCNDNFTIQLAGAKQWRYSKTEHYEKPLHNYYKSEPQRLSFDPTYHSAVPAAVLDDLETVTLEAGDMLYTPVGFWHETKATAQSLSFNLSLSPMPWSNVLLQALQPLLNDSPAWRATAMRDPDECGQRIAALIDALQATRPEDFLRTARTRADAPDEITADTVLRRNPLVWWHTPTPTATDTARIEVVFPDTTLRKLTVDNMFLSLLTELPTGGRPFAVRALLSRWPHDSDEGCEFLHALVTIGLLSVAEGDAEPA
ncbi:MAG: hypothetical protein Tsb0020_44820 [Haliangiales bacterium]